MKKIRFLAGLLCVFSITTISFAADANNVVGTWVGVAHAAVLGVNSNHNTKDPQAVQFVKTQYTIVIEKQEGQNFSGYHFSKHGKKSSFVGAFRSNMKSGVISDKDGTIAFDMLGNNMMDSCYTHTVSSNGTSTVASCYELKRQ
jgi:hypothetical protein